MDPTTAPGHPLHFAAPHPTDGRAIRYHFDEFMIDLIERVTDRLGIDDQMRELSEVAPAEEIRAYVGQSLYPVLIDTARALFRYMFLAEQGTSCAGVLFCPTALHMQIRPELKLLPNIRLVGAHDFGYQKLRSLWHKWELVKPSHWKKATAPKVPDTPCVAVELVEGADTGQKSDVFWLVSGEIDPSQVLFVFERHNAGLVDIKAERCRIESVGARMVALHPSVSDKGNIPIWTPLVVPNWANAMKRQLSCWREKTNGWAYATLIRCIDRVAYWEVFFQSYRVAISQNFTEISADTLAKRMAIGRLGGVEVGKMRSEIFEPSGTAFHFIHEAAFVWHRNVQSLLKFSRTNVKYVLETGYIFDYLFTQRAAAAARIRSELRNRGAFKIIAAFDNAAHLNGHLSARQLEDYYRCLAEIVVARPNVGIILKPKKQISRLQYQLRQRLAKRLGLKRLAKKYPLELPNIDESMAILRNSGRCVELIGVKANVIDAGLAADIVTGIPCSTAACEAALAGRPLLMYDPSASRGNPVSGGSYAASFNTIDEFRARIIAHLDGVSEERANVLTQVDPMRDGLAAARVGAFFAGYLDAYASGANKSKCIQQAVSAFEHHGGHAIICSSDE
jgi:hypothetical protein